ncbi:MAG: transketolase C-terminal domain-containing protein, partial [Pseudomonadota bacterium]
FLVVHEAVAVGGFGAELAATVAETARGLKAPVARLGAPRAPIAYAPTMEAVLKITPEKIAQRCGASCRQRLPPEGALCAWRTIVYDTMKTGTHAGSEKTGRNERAEDHRCRRGGPRPCDVSKC